MIYYELDNIIINKSKVNKSKSKIFLPSFKITKNIILTHY